MTVITTQKIINTAVPSYTGIKVDLEQIGRELTECLLPQSSNPKISKILDRISELSMFRCLKETPENRITRGWAKGGDFQFQQEIQKLIYSDIIKPQTMVIANTGHDIPMLAQLYKNGHLHFNSAFKVKFEKDDGNMSRVADQTFTWGDQIKQAAEKIGNKHNGLFLGLDTHRDWKIDTTQLPSAQELKNLGITRVVHLIEGSPTKVFSSQNTSELKEYYRNLEKEGLEVLYKGVDPRHQDGFGREIFSSSIYETPCRKIYDYNEEYKKTPCINNILFKQTFKL